MVKQKDSRTLILVCQRAFSRIVEHLLRSEGFTNFQRGGLNETRGKAIESREGKEVFVLVTDAGSATRLADVLRACPIRGTNTDLFEFYTVGN